MIDQFQDRIIYAQAMNCAAQIVSKMEIDSVAERSNAIKEWREWFYEELCKVPPRTLAEQKVPRSTQAILDPAGPKKRNPLNYRPAKWQPEQQGDETPATIDSIYGPGTGPRGGQFEG